MKTVALAVVMVGSTAMAQAIGGTLNATYLNSDNGTPSVQVDVNLKAAFFLCREVGLALTAAGRGGRIVTFTSQGWWTGGFGGSVVYRAAKGGVVSFTRGLARTFGAAGITANSVSPGAVETPMLLTDLTDEDVAAMEKATPLGRLGKPDELAGPVVFLLSHHASFVSGATLNVSGAWLMY